MDVGFFSSTAECSPQKQIKNLLKKDASHLKIAWDISKTRNRSKTLKKKEKEKQKMRKCQTTAFRVYLFI